MAGMAAGGTLSMRVPSGRYLSARTTVRPSACSCAAIAGGAGTGAGAITGRSAAGAALALLAGSAFAAVGGAAAGRSLSGAALALLAGLEIAGAAEAGGASGAAWGSSAGRAVVIGLLGGSRQLLLPLLHCGSRSQLYWGLCRLGCARRLVAGGVAFFHGAVAIGAAEHNDASRYCGDKFVPALADLRRYQSPGFVEDLD